VYGDEASDAVKKARREVSKLIKAAQDTEIIFTSGATESNNLAIQGVARALKNEGKDHIVTSEIEHKAVLDSVSALEREGWRVTRIKPKSDGSLDLTDIAAAIEPKTGLLSFMHVNNEIGNINILSKIGQLAGQHNIFFHVDAAQSFGKIAIDVQTMNIHLLSISGHKIYGPKGIGALYVRKRNPNVPIIPLVYGGGHERGLRSGTLAAALIVGLGEAARLAGAEMKKEVTRVDELRDKLYEGLKEKCSDLIVNGSLINRIPHCINISFPGVDSEALMMRLRKGIAVSNGSACTSMDWKSSYVLKAIGVSDAQAKSAVRFGFGRFTTAEEIDYAVKVIGETVNKLKHISNYAPNPDN
jgi:cysteine desulfurase